MNDRRRRLLIAAAMTGALASRHATAAESGKVRTLVSGAAPGGVMDTAWRAIAQQLNDTGSHHHVLDTQPGAGGALAANQFHRMAGSRGDAFLIAAASVFSIMPRLEPPPLRFNPLAELAPVIVVGTFPHLVVTGASSRIDTLKSHLERLKASGGEFVYATMGHGTTGHFAGEQMAERYGVGAVHVPFKMGAAAAVVDVASGRIPVGILDFPSTQAMLESGRVRALGVTSAVPFRKEPEFAPLAAQGFPGVDVYSWSGLFAHKGAEDLDALNASVRAALKDPRVEEAFRKSGIVPLQLDVGGSEAFVRRYVERWAQIMKSSRIRLEA